MKNVIKGGIAFVSILILTATGCRKADEIFKSQNENASASKKQIGSAGSDSYLVQSWYSLMMKLIIETPGHTPPIAARSFGYTGVALYESLVSEMPNHHSLGSQLNGIPSIPRPLYGNSYVATITANAALARIIKNLFQNASAANLDRIDSLELSIDKLYSGPFSENKLSRSREYGRAVANAVFRWSLTDGGNRAYLNIFPTDYIPPVGQDKWIPTPPVNQTAMLPYWGNNRPMLLSNTFKSVDPDASPAFSNAKGSTFYDAANEVYTVGLHLSGEQKTIALYWADGGGTFTPPGHNLAITLQMVRNHNLNLSDAAILLAKVGIAQNDAAIVCWRAKFKTNLLRPVTYIQSYIDPNWLPLINTPPFPSYTSGHSTFSGAAAEILTVKFGNHISFTDSSKIPFAFAPRSFNNFYEFAEEAAISRLYGGIHYAFDNLNGFKCGELVAKNVERLKW